MLFRNILLILLLTGSGAYCQQDVDFHINTHLFAGKKILKVKRDFYDPYVWVLAQNNGVYRINSQTLLVDDYSSKFTAYSNEPMVDIQGYSQDTACVVTGSRLITFFNGVAAFPNAAITINGTINTIGRSGFSNSLNLYTGLFIGTETGGYYDYDFVKIQPAPNPNGPGYARIYESTYRSLMLADYSFGFFNPAITNDVDILSQVTFDITTIWRGGQFGTRPNTAFYKEGGPFPVSIFANLFWGTDNGFFQITNDTEQQVGLDYYHYLSGVKVNKITDLLGLNTISLRDTAGDLYAKETLLIGTDTGLYFSRSVLYDEAKKSIYRTPLFHYDPLGKAPVNDICVNRLGISSPFYCENGVWVATDDGLYFLNPDYGKYISAHGNLAAINFDLPNSDTLSKVQICSGSSVSLLLNPYAGGDNTVQWEKDGVDIVGQTGSTLAVKDSGDYSVILYTPCGNIHLETNHLKVKITSGPVFTFNYPDKIQQCNNNPYTLKIDNTPGYHYQWYTNGVLNGDTTPSYTVTQTGKYKVEVSACTNSWVPSKEVEVDLITLPMPQITADKPVYCAADIAALSINTPTDPGYTINWYRDGNLLTADKDLTSIKEITAGSYTVAVNSNISSCTQTSSAFQLAFTPSPVFNFNYPDEMQYCNGTPVTLKAVGNPAYQYRWYKDETLTGDVNATLAITQAGKYKIEVSGCAGSWVPSKEVQIDFIQLPIPVIAADKPVYCIGDNATLSVALAVDPDQTITWYKDNVPLANGSNQTSITTDIGGSYTVSIVNNTVNTDGSTCSQTSAVQALAFNPPPTVSIEKIVKTTICDGQTIDLLAHYNGGTVKWSTGESSDQISTNTAGNYKATITSPAGCVANANIDITFLPDPVFNVKDTSICTYKHQSITLTAPAGFSLYEWNGQSGGQTYTVTNPQIVALTITDANGCQATQQIKVADQCPNVWIPNTFTPNGDGINDTWVIEGLDNDQTVLVRVYTRYGTQIYESKGYGIPWNGEYNSKKLPAGVYYYIVNAKSGTQKFSGSLTIIY